MIWKILIAFFVSLAGSALLTPIARWAGFRFGIADRVGDTTPSGEVKIHKKTTPRTGGIAIFVACMVTFLIFGDFSIRSIGIVIGAVIIFVVMLIDDMKKLPWWIKLIGAILAATAPIMAGLRIGYLTNIIEGGWLTLEWLSIPLTYIWIVGMTNAMNFIDGLDGLAAGITVIATIGAVIASFSKGELIPAVLLACICGSAAGFLPWNFKPAKIIMGDSGANFIGYIISVAAIWGTAKATTAAVIGVCVIALAVPMSDVFITSIRRILKGQSPMIGGLDNIHYVLLKKGWSERNVVLVFYLITALLSAAAVTFILVRMK